MSTTLAPGLARKVRKILDLKTENPDLLKSLELLSDFYDNNTPAARRKLQSLIEHQALDISDEYLRAADGVIQRLDGVQQQLDFLSSSCREVNEHVCSSCSVAAALLEEVDSLQAGLQRVQLRRSLISEFLSQYELSDQEVWELQEGEVGERFFDALERVRRIYDNCRTLLRTHRQRAGLELLDRMALYQETAFERLCRWVYGQCQSGYESSVPEIDPQLQRALQLLRVRPVLFQYCAEEVASARQGAVFQEFVAALTRGGPGGLPRPIEMHSHDPRRYISDMLAWVHQAIASERELFDSLMGSEDVEAPAASAADGGASPKADAAARLGTTSLLDSVFESLCKPLKVRIEQVLLLSQPPPLLCYQLQHLLQFYAATVQGILGAGAKLTQTLQDCNTTASRIFFDQLKIRGESLLRNPAPPPKNLAAGPAVQEGVQLLLDMVEVHAKVLSAPAPAADGAAGSDQDGFPAVVQAVLDPLLQLCERSAAAIKPDNPSQVGDAASMDPDAHLIYHVNCLASVLTSLAPHASCQAAAEQLRARLDTQVMQLVEQQANRLLDRCGLLSVCRRMQVYAETKAAGGTGQEVMAHDPALEKTVVVTALRSFFSLISSPDVLPEFERLQLPRIRSRVRAALATSLAAAYEAAYDALADESNGYAGGTSTVRHTPSDVRTILGAGAA